MKLEGKVSLYETFAYGDRTVEAWSKVEIKNQKQIAQYKRWWRRDKKGTLYLSLMPSKCAMQPI